MLKFKRNKNNNKLKEGVRRDSSPDTTKLRGFATKPGREQNKGKVCIFPSLPNSMQHGNNKYVFIQTEKPEKKAHQSKTNIVIKEYRFQGS